VLFHRRKSVILAQFHAPVAPCDVRAAINYLSDLWSLCFIDLAAVIDVLLEAEYVLASNNQSVTGGMVQAVLYTSVGSSGGVSTGCAATYSCILFFFASASDILNYKYVTFCANAISPLAVLRTKELGNSPRWVQ